MLRTVEERGVRLIRLWFTDVLGQLKSVAISPAELENAFEEGMHFDGSAIDGFSRVQESDVLAKPDPNSFELLPWAKGDDPSARMFCDIQNHDGTPFEGDPRQVLKRNLDQAREQGFSFYVAPEMEFFYFADGDPSHPPATARLGLLLRPDHRRCGQRPAQAHHPHARGHGHPGGVLLPRGRPQPARDRPALHRRPVDGRQRHDVPPGGARDRPRTGRVRHVHAQAARRGPGLGHAHPPVAVRGRHQRLPRARATPTACRRWPAASSPACSSTPRRSPRSRTSWSTRTSGSSPATRRRCT